MQKHGICISTEAYPYGAGATGIGAAFLRDVQWQERLGGLEKSDISVAGEFLTDQRFDQLQKEAPDTKVIVHFFKPDTNADDRIALDRAVLFPGAAIASDGGWWIGADGTDWQHSTGRI